MKTLINSETIHSYQTILSSFQADDHFQKIPSSCEKADQFLSKTPELIDALAQLTLAAGLPPVHRIVASAPDQKFMLFSLQSKEPDSLILGLSTKPDSTPDSLIDLLTPLLESA